MKKAILFFTLFYFILFLFGCQSRETADNVSLNNYKTVNDYPIQEMPSAQASLKSEIKAVYSDIRGAVTTVSTCEAIKKGADFAKANGFNTVCVKFNPYSIYLFDTTNATYKTDIQSENVALINKAVSSADEQGIRVFFDIDVFVTRENNFAAMNEGILIAEKGDAFEKLTRLNPSKFYSVSFISNVFSKMSKDIHPDGYILSGLDYISETVNDETEIKVSKLSPAEYRKNCILKAGQAAVSSIKSNDSNAVICYNTDMPVLYADKTAILNEKIFDAAVGKMTDTALFEAGVPVLVSHNSDGTVYSLSDEYLSVKNKENYAGSIYNNLSTLAGSNCLEALRLAYENKIDDQTKSIELNISTPSNNITTEGENIVIQGSCDNNFPLYMNGQTIAPSSKGNFAVDYKLKNGKNVITFEHKNKKSELVVNYYMRVIRDISPSKSVTIASENEVGFTVYARKGAAVKGVINKSTIIFKEKDTSDYDNKGKIDDGFALFEGVYKAPVNNNSSLLNIGVCTVTSSYKGFVQSLKSGTILVEDKYGKRSDNKRYIMEVTADFAETFDNDMAYSVIDKALPVNVYLPKGTKDYVIGEVAYSDEGEDLSYYKLACGKRIYKKDAVLTLSDEALEGNITSVSAVDNGRFTDIIFDTSAKAPFVVDFNVPFAKFSKTAGFFDFTCNYNARKIDFTLHNIKSAGEINFIPNSLLSNISVSKLTDNSYQYSLTLSKAGRFYGFTSLYNENGKLVLRLFNPSYFNAETDRFSDGFKVVVDAGHGAKDPGALGFDKTNYPEKVLNLKVALLLAEKLRNSGAEVILSRTDDSVTSRDVVNDIVKRENPNLMISVHHNSSTSSAPFGPEAYYFYPFNQGLALSVVSAVNRPHFADANKNYYMSVFNQRTHNGMKVLIECAFMSNPNDWEYAVKNSDVFAERIAQGIKNYYKQ